MIDDLGGKAVAIARVGWGLHDASLAGLQPAYQTGYRDNAIKDDGDLGPLAAVRRRGLHLRDHVLEKQQRAVVDRGKAGAEPTGETQLPGLLFNDFLIWSPNLNFSKIRRAVSEKPLM